MVASDANPWRYCGEYFDKETGNIYLRARYYNPSIGRFTQDSIEYVPSGNLIKYCVKADRFVRLSFTMPMKIWYNFIKYSAAINRYIFTQTVQSSAERDKGEKEECIVMTRLKKSGFWKCMSILLIVCGILFRLGTTHCFLKPPVIADIVIYAQGWGDEYKRYTLTADGHLQIKTGSKAYGAVATFLSRNSVYLDARMANITKRESKYFSLAYVKKIIAQLDRVQAEDAENRAISDGAVIILQYKGKTEYVQDRCYGSKSFSCVLALMEAQSPSAELDKD